ncbi:MAG TPA: PQQ-dependent sugar dehydrogenase [Longimicrobiales bacterium]|nr:PQQ-dependent sugar dehydrogenase [Longimicrobiales bacterium]
MTTTIGMAVLLLAPLGCGDAYGPADTDTPPDSTDSPPDSTPNSLRMVRVATGLTDPVFLTAPSGDGRQFIVEQSGRIRILADGQVAAVPFLDIGDRVLDGGERGLLGLAFHPDYASNGRFYVHYTRSDGTSRIARFQAGSGADVADPESESVVLEVAQPFSNHNAGMLEFGPDGLLYIAFGDGGGSGDPNGNGQDTGTLLGSLLRIDVDGADPYAIPAGNPFPPGGSERPEIWAWGLRNPWRFSIDSVAGRIWIGDVGQNSAEEINRQPLDAAAVNYGWSVMEGRSCFEATSCDQAGLARPLVEYGHDEGCSVIGGYVYRGPAAELQGLYFFSDFCSGFVRSVAEQSEPASPTEWETPNFGRVLSFGRDAVGELYLLTAAGDVWRIDGIAK